MVDYVYKQVSSILFRLISPDEVKTISSAKIVTAELYDKEGYPVDGGLMDIQLGVIDPGLRCKTCGGKLKECMGHFGHIELARPVMHVLFVDIMYAVLRGTCRECHKILLDDEKAAGFYELVKQADIAKTADVRRKITKSIVNKVKLIKKCPHCGDKQQPIKLEKPSTFMEGGDRRLTPIEVRERLSKVSDRDVELLGVHTKYARPEWAVLRVLSIPPVTMRPSIG